MDTYNDLRDPARQAARQGQWDSCVKLGLQLPPEWNVFSLFPKAAGKAGMPDEAVNSALDVLSFNPELRDNALPQFLFELSGHLAPTTGAATLNRIAGLGNDDEHVIDGLKGHTSSCLLS